MSKRALVFFVLLVVVLPTVAQATDIKQSFDLQVPGHSYKTIDVRTGALGDRVYGHFIVTEGTQITFLILNETEYAKFANDKPCTAAYALFNQIEANFSFDYPQYSGSWYFILDNKDSNIVQHVVGDLFQGPIPPTPTTTTPVVTFEITSTTIYVLMTLGVVVLALGLLSFYSFLKRPEHGSERTLEGRR